MAENLDKLIEAQVERKDLLAHGVELKHINPDLIEIFILDNHPNIRSAVYYQRRTPERKALSFGTIFYKLEDRDCINKYLPIKNETSFIGRIKDDYDIIKLSDR